MVLGVNKLPYISGLVGTIPTRTYAMNTRTNYEDQ